MKESWGFALFHESFCERKREANGVGEGILGTTDHDVRHWRRIGFLSYHVRILRWDIYVVKTVVYVKMSQRNYISFILRLKSNNFPSTL